MKLTKSTLRKLVQEIINEVEFHGETPAGQLYDTEEEDARFKQQLVWEKELKQAGLDREEINFVIEILEGRLDKHDLLGTSAYEKLFGYYTSSPPEEVPEMPYGVAKARTGMPDEWILDYLNSLAPTAGRMPMAAAESPLVPKNPKLSREFAPLNIARRRTPGPGGQRRRESMMREKITKKKLQKIVQEELQAFLAEARKGESDE